MTLRWGRMAYTNALPLYAAFDAGELRFPGVMHSAVPTELNAMLRRGELDAGPVSAFAYAADWERYVLLPDLCIGAHDAVRSVLLFSPYPLAELDGIEIAVTRQSASGDALLRLLLQSRYGVRPQYVSCDDPFERAAAGRPAFLIGDRAIDALFAFDPHDVYDLGSLWHQWTGEQSVFAVWVARRQAFAEHESEVRAGVVALVQSRSWGQTHGARVLELAQRAHARPLGFYEDYYAKLNFNFDLDARRGFAAFCSRLHAAGAIKSLPPVAQEEAFAAP